MRFLALLLFATIAFAEPLKVDISSKSAIVINADTGAILYGKDPYATAYPASITKIATALYALERKGHALDEQVVARRECLERISPVVKHANYDKHASHLIEYDGSNVGLRAGDTLSLRVLLYGLMLASGDDAANVIAHQVSGNIERFMAELNLYLASKGIKNTRFTNAHGLHHPSHQTTAYDMAMLTREALKHPFFRELVKTVKYPKPKSDTHYLQSNKLLRPGQHFYPKAIGVKTGYTSHAKFTLVAAAVHEGRTLIAVVLGAPDAPSRYRDAIRLFEAAFSQKPQMRTYFTAEHDRFTTKLKGGSRVLEGALDADLKMTYFPAEEPEVKPHLVWNNTALPIEAGQKVGELQLVDPKGTVVKAAPLFAMQAVEETFWFKIQRTCSEHRKALIFTFLSLNFLLVLLYFFKKSHKVKHG
ncbi:MAG: D-alanyl-D-alanine carboxypeptidase [Verrucomicrobia bacterium]|nr:D-alanyl-D-alanine carboxypeptidase [Verrucomicrobiota bacterium]